MQKTATAHDEAQ